MKDRFDLAELAFTESFDEHGLVEVVGDPAVDQIAELAAVAQVVDDDDVVAAAAIELADQIAPDESGASSDDNHGCAEPVTELRPRPSGTSSCNRGISLRL